jgi:hypothetical protein
MMLRTRLFAVLALSILAASSLAAHADTYEYDFSAPSFFGSPAVSLSFDEAALLTSDTTITAANFLTMTGGPVSSFEINPTSGDCVGFSGGSSCININFSGGSILGVEASDAADTTGTFDYSLGTLTITDLTPSAATPEPSSIALLGTGVLGLAGVVRRRLLAA